MSSIYPPVSKAMAEAIAALQQGRPILLTDAKERENEADLVYVAEHIQTEDINFMAMQARGLICLSLAPDIVDRLQLPLMTAHNRTRFHTPFTVSIEASQGVSTGITAQDRAHTIRTVLKEAATAADYVSPGHVFPLRADARGVLGRAGHTEGSVDLVRIAGFQAAAVICEVLDEQGDSARGEALDAFAKRHHIPRVSILELQDYRLQQEILATPVTQAALPTEVSDALEISAYQSLLEDDTIVVLKHPRLDVSQPVVVRIHSECLTGDVFGSLRCDCGLQLRQALQQVADWSIS
jgi:3,4-dihydroxy 2-butanone 4-phosphate synthase/GTP cyclohydrolase II